MPITLSALMCHAPIVIPQIGQQMSRKCSNSTLAMRKICEKITKINPEVVVVISPHSPRVDKDFSFYDRQTVTGNFDKFGHPEVTFSFSVDTDTCKKIVETSAALPISYDTITMDHLLDHGAAVPLFFLDEAGWQGPIVVLGLAQTPSTKGNLALGELLKTVAAAKDTVIIASGDMSHRLTAEAPCGFHPQAQSFDDYVHKRLAEQSYRQLLTIDEQLRLVAAEDVIDSLQIALEASEFRTDGADVLSYEGPFGVGYLNAILNQQNQGDGDA